MRLYLNVDVLNIPLKKGNIYIGEEVPLMFNPDTFQAEPKAYIIKCDDGKYRKVMADCFLTIDELRELKLNKLGIN